MCVGGEGFEQDGFTDDSTMRLMCFACWTTRARNTHSEHKILLLSDGNSGCSNASQFYVCTFIACFV